MTKNKLWVILPGGGVKGVYQLGFLETLLKEHPEYEIDRVYGTSIGAVLSPLIASSRFDIIHDIFDNIRDVFDVLEPWSWIENMFKFLPIFTRLGAYKKVKIVDTVLEKLTLALTDDQIRDCFSKCHVVAWDVMNKKEVWFTQDQLPIGIKASSALTIAVPPVEHDGTLYTDGGVTEIIPITKAISDYKELQDTDVKILVVDCSPRVCKKLSKPPDNPIMYTLELLSDAALSLTMTEFAKIKEENPEMSISYIKPRNDPFDNAIDIDKEKMDKYFELGCEDAKTFTF